MLTLAKDKNTDYRIVVSESAPVSDLHAAGELAGFLREISGAVFPVVTDAEPPADKEILVGLSKRTEKYLRRMEPLRNEGCYIRTDYQRLVLAGKGTRGTLYAVYGFLEEFLGCRWFTAEVSHIPKRDELTIPSIAKLDQPAFEYREPFFYEAFDGDWAVRNRVNSNAAALDAARGGKMTYGRFGHTFNELVPPDRYFDEHPEYFSMVNGERLRERTQLCLTNPDVLRIATEKVREWMRSMPEAAIFSVSQNDCQNRCECPDCRKLEEEEGAASGPIIRFVNQIAEALEEEFPDKKIDTFAYSYSYRAPRHVRPHKNVVVRMCDIECCFVHPLTDNCPNWPKTPEKLKDRTFPNELARWAKLCDNMYVWDYCTNFIHFLMPRPDLPVLPANLRFFRDNGVKGLFEQGSYVSPGGYMAELKAYLMAKLMWNPDADEAVITDEFLAGVYGCGAGLVRKIMDTFRADYLASGEHLYFSTHAGKLFTTLDFAGLEKYRAMFARLEALALNEQQAKAVRKFKLCFRYLELYKMPLDYPERDLIIDRFVADLKEFGVTKFEETYSLERSVEWMRESLDPDRKFYGDWETEADTMIEP